MSATEWPRKTWKQTFRTGDIMFDVMVCAEDEDSARLTSKLAAYFYALERGWLSS